MASDIARPSKSRKPIKNPCGHISLDFHPDDAPTMTDERMAAIARDYISMMGFENTPYIVVRHNDKKHPHCHLVFSRVDYNGNILKQTSNYKKNERVCKALNEKYGLNIGKNKLQTDITKLHGREKVRYQLAWDILRSLDTGINGSWEAFRQSLSEKGVGVRIKTSKAGNPNLYFSKDGYEIWGEKIMPVFKVSEIENYWKVKSRRAARTQKPKPEIPKETPGQSTEAPQRQFVNPDGTYNVRPIEDLLQIRFTQVQLTGYRQGKAVKLEGLTTLPSTFIWVKFDKKTSEPRFYKTNPDLTAKPIAKTSRGVPKAADSPEKPTAETTPPIEIPPLPKDFMGARIAPHELVRYQKGDAVCAYICKPDEIVGKHYWIWYDFKTAQPRCEPTPPPVDRYIPEAFKLQMTAAQSPSVNNPQRAAINFSATSLGGARFKTKGSHMVRRCPTTSSCGLPGTPA